MYEMENEPEVDDDESHHDSEGINASGSSSAKSSGKRKSRSGTVFRSWSFRLTVKTDLGHGATAEEKGKLLTEHLRTRTGHTRPSSVTGVAVFCDKSLFSVPPDSAGLVSIEVQGYVQAIQGKQLSTMQKWIDSATWKPVPGGLSSDAEYQTNMRKFNDPNDSMTRLMVYGRVGANNAGRAADKQARQAAHEAEVAERLVAKRRRAALGDITNRPVTVDDTSWGRDSSSSYAAAAFHASSSSGSPSMRSSSSSYAACFGSPAAGGVIGGGAVPLVTGAPPQPVARPYGRNSEYRQQPVAGPSTPGPSRTSGPPAAAGSMLEYEFQDEIQGTRSLSSTSGGPCWVRPVSNT